MRLRRSNSAGPGIHRMRSGSGFFYRDAAGATIADPELLARIARLVIPPAWTEVWIAPYPNGHIQATGLDAAGRRQYLYHPLWREQKDRVKFDRMLAFAGALPAARRSVTRDLRTEHLSREGVLAGAFRMLDSAALRIGSERYVDENGRFGLSTMLCAHATVLDGGVVRLRFPAKSGHAWESELHDRDLAPLVRGRNAPSGRGTKLSSRRCGRRPRCSRTLRRSPGRAMSIRDCWTATRTARRSTPPARARWRPSCGRCSSPDSVYAPSSGGHNGRAAGRRPRGRGGHHGTR